MKNSKQQNNSPFPFEVDHTHIYNILMNKGIAHVNTGVNRFDIELHSNIIWNGHEANGVTDFVDHAIKMEVSLTNKKAKEVLFHEITHIVLDSLGLDDLNFPQGSIITSNESLVAGLTHQFMLVNALNPELFLEIFDD